MDVNKANKIKENRIIKYADKFLRLLDLDYPRETPGRFANMLRELTENQNVPNKKIAEYLDKTFEYEPQTNSQDMVIVKDIECFSLCHHDIALMYDMKISVAYIPKDFVIGLSKIVRACEMVCKRLQLQERIGTDIAEIMKILTKSPDVAVHIEVKHSCVTARGIKTQNAKTITTNFSGLFAEKTKLKLHF